MFRAHWQALPLLETGGWDRNNVTPLCGSSYTKVASTNIPAFRGVETITKEAPIDVLQESTAPEVRNLFSSLWRNLI